jgi:SAM-dependent MidA family methyltransferase
MLRQVERDGAAQTPGGAGDQGNRARRHNAWMHSSSSVSAPPNRTINRLIHGAIMRNGGWLPFDRFMAMALYAPGLGYYANPGRKFGALPESGSDFITAPELSPLFGQALARQVGQALRASGSAEIWEFGAGSGALAAQLLDALGNAVQRYTIVELSSALRERQTARLQAHAGKLNWADALPDTLQGVIVGNEVLDAMPVQLLHFDGAQWFERGVAALGEAFAWNDRPTTLRPPFEGRFAPDTTTETHPQAEAFIATLAERLTRGAAFFIDYGFPEAEYYHPQRSGGTLMCHRAHRSDHNPLADVGLKDITAHVNFSAIALAGQNAGLTVLGYANQARFLMNCGIMQLLQGADLRTTANAQKLLTEHEMGELFKVIGFAHGCDDALMLSPLGFSSGDRSHTL